MDEDLRSRLRPPEPEQPAQPSRPHRPVVRRPITRPTVLGGHHPANGRRPMFGSQPTAPPPAPQVPAPSAAPAHHQPTQHHQPAHHPTTPAAQLPAVPVPKHHRRRRFSIVKIFILLLIIGAAGGGGYYYVKYLKPPTPLPQSLVNSLNFPVYYPTKLPGEYKYQAGSAVNQNGLFTYKIADGSNAAVINEQTKPGGILNPKSLPSFKPIAISGATVLIGDSGGATTIIYSSPTTLINITSLNNISRSDVIFMAQHLSPIKKTAKLL